MDSKRENVALAKSAMIDPGKPPPANPAVEVELRCEVCETGRASIEFRRIKQNWCELLLDGCPTVVVRLLESHMLRVPAQIHHVVLA